MVVQKRHIEMATDAIVFRPLRPVFTYGFTFCVMLVGGAYFGQMQQKMSWVILDTYLHHYLVTSSPA